MSPDSAKRLEQLAAKPALNPTERGELLAMARSSATPAERGRIALLLNPGSAPSTTPEYERGVQRGQTHRPSRLS